MVTTRYTFYTGHVVLATGSVLGVGKGRGTNLLTIFVVADNALQLDFTFVKSDEFFKTALLMI